MSLGFSTNLWGDIVKNKIIYMLAIFVLLLINFTTPIISVQANSTTEGKVFIPKKQKKAIIES